MCASWLSYPGIKLTCTVKTQEFWQHACALQSKGAVSLEVAILCAVQLPCKAVYASHTYHFLNVDPVGQMDQNVARHRSVTKCFIPILNFLACVQETETVMLQA